MSDNYDNATAALLISLRGGFPDACDFCGQPFTAKRWPVPEESGAWACSECDARWTGKEP
jgi:ribosomal protein L37AE/L43A